MCDNQDPLNLFDGNVKNKNTGAVHLIIGRITGCGITVSGKKWIVSDSDETTCEACVHNRKLFYKDIQRGHTEIEITDSISIRVP